MLTLGRRILPGMLGRSFADESAASEWLPPMLQMSELAGYRRTLLSSMRHMPCQMRWRSLKRLGPMTIRLV